MVNYEDQEKYWTNIKQDTKSMANDNEFHEKDIELTKEFIVSIRELIKGEKVVDLCGGISRFGEVL